MILMRSSNYIYGTYDTPQGQGIIDGYINAQNVWIGTWTEAFGVDWGYFLVAFSNDTSRLWGTWKYAEGPDCDGYLYYWDHNYSGGWSFEGEKVK